MADALLISPNEFLLLPDGGRLLLPAGGEEPTETTAEEYIRGAPALQELDAAELTTAHAFLRGAAGLSHPEDFIRGGVAQMNALRDIYLNGDPLVRAVAAHYLRGGTLLQRDVEIFVRGAVDFGLRELGRYLKGGAAFAARTHGEFMRGAVSFDHHGEYIGGLVTLARASNLQDTGNAPASPTTPGIMSRQYLSLVSVKKEIT